MPQVIKVASWNVNSIRTRLPHLLAWLAENRPDALCLQETKVEDTLFPHAALQGSGYTAVAHGQKSYNGVAILSRHPLDEVVTGFNGHNVEEQSRVISATMNGIRLVSAYVPNGESLKSPKFLFKEAFYRHMVANMREQLQHHPSLVLMGDFNIAADERDVANPERASKGVLFTPQEREWLHGLQQSTGLKDAFRLVSQEANVYSWWDYRTYGRAPASGMRIDYAFVSPALASRVQAVTHCAEERTKPQPSDHVPVLLTLATE